ncbi:putative fluoride ion transporter CrcB 1 [Allostella sp. ATCC 35155]|nr:putative fluoride ion transporter CrcB 1 [Stella sp. ATCC 35155]
MSGTLNFLMVMLGSAFGGGARYAIELAFPYTPPNSSLPLATLSVNVIGSLLAGIFIGLSLPGGPLYTTRAALFLVTGVCGGFTTFSAFSLHTLALMQEGEPYLALIYVGLSVVLCVIAAALGYMIGAEM